MKGRIEKIIAGKDFIRKGLQVNMVDDALALGIGHAVLNLNLPAIARPAAAEYTITYRMDGKDYYFDTPYLEKFDRRVKELSNHGIVVTLILLNSMKWDGVTIDPSSVRIYGIRILIMKGRSNDKGIVEGFAE